MSTTQPDLMGIHALRSPHARAAQNGDGVIAGEVMLLFEEHHDRLLGYVLTFGLSRHDGEEIVQEVFLSLFRHLQLGRPRSNLRAWLFAVAHNLSLKQRMTNQRWHKRLDGEVDVLEQHHDPAPNPEECAVSAQRQRRLLAIVDALPEQDRRCLYLRSEGLRYREIAKTVGISLGSVSISLSRSFGRLMRAGEL